MDGTQDSRLNRVHAVTEHELQQSFEARRPALTELGDWVVYKIVSELEKQLGSGAAVDKFLQIPPKPRVKETDSFLEKALVRKPKPNPLADITDQVGVRFVVLRLEDITRIGQIIEAGTWDWQKDRDFEAERLSAPDYFAYQSDHYVIKTRAEFRYKEILIPKSLPCEIQIRTILQHAYAEMAHATAYKPPIKLPDVDQKRINRSLAKGSALIEATDDVFGEITKKLQDYNESLVASLEASKQVYRDLTGEEPNSPTIIGEMIADAYRNQLRGVNLESLRAWVNERGWLGAVLKEKRKSSVLYRDSVVILIGWLITQFEATVPAQWPLDSNYLEEMYNVFGVSTNGLF
jgi:ppGpp synthetase/RelA/SpoT-type nucleotidyltranferase